MRARKNIIVGSALAGILVIAAPAAFGGMTETRDRARTVPVAHVAEPPVAVHVAAAEDGTAHPGMTGPGQCRTDTGCGHSGDQAGTPMEQRHEASHEGTNHRDGHRTQPASPGSAEQAGPHGGAHHVGSGDHDR